EPQSGDALVTEQPCQHAADGAATAARRPVQQHHLLEVCPPRQHVAEPLLQQVLRRMDGYRIRRWPYRIKKRIPMFGLRRCCVIRKRHRVKIEELRRVWI